MASKFELSLVIGAALASSFRSNVGTAERQLHKLGAAVDELSRADQRLGATGGVKSVVSDLRRSQVRLQSTLAARQANLDRRSSLQGQLLGAVGLAYGLKKLADSYEDVARARGELATLSIGSSGLDDIERQGRQMSNVWSGLSTSDFIRASYDIKSGIASLGDAAVGGMTRISALTAKATKGGTSQMTSLFATGYGIYRSQFEGWAAEHIAGWQNLSAEEKDIKFGEAFSGSLSTSVKNFKTTGSQMQQYLENVGATAEKAGYRMSSIFAIGGQLQNIMSGSEAGTKFRAFLDTAGAAGKELGLNFVNASGQLKELPDILDAIRGKYGETIDAAEQQQLKKAFGTQEAVAFLTGLIDKSDDLRKAQGDLENAMKGGLASTMQMAKAAEQGTSWQIAGQSARGFSEVIAKQLSPASDTLATGLGTVFSKGQALVERFPLLSKVVFGATAGIIAMTVAAVGLGYGFTFVKGGLLKAKLAVNSFRASLALMRASSTGSSITSMLPGVSKITSLRTAFSGLGGVLPAVTSGLRAMGVAALTNPVVLIGAAIAGVAFLVYKYWGPIKSFFTGVWEGISAAAQPVLTSLAPAFEWMGRALAPVGRLLKPIWDGIKGIGSAIASFFTTADHGASEGARNLGQKIGSALFKGLKFMFMNFTPIGLIIQLGSAIRNAFSGLSLAESGKKLLSTLVEGIKSGAAAVTGALGSVLKKARNLLPFSDAKEGPLSTLTLSGASIPATIGQGIAAAGAGHLVTPLSAALAEASKVIGNPNGGRQLSALVASRDTSRPAAGGAGAPVVVNYSPQITIQGDASRADIDAALGASEGRIKRLIEEVLHNERRISFD